MSDMSPLDDPLAPPTSGEMYIEPPVTKWPTVIGVIGIILACLGLVCGLAGYFQLPIQRWGAKMQEGTPGEVIAQTQLKVAEQFHSVMLIIITIGMALTVWLLVGSIKLARRRRSARTHLIAWSMVSILNLTLNMAVQYVAMQATAKALVDAGQGQFVKQLWIGMAVGGCFGVVLGLALQVFLLIWFSRQKIKNEVAMWPG